MLLDITAYSYFYSGLLVSQRYNGNELGLMADSHSVPRFRIGYSVCSALGVLHPEVSNIYEYEGNVNHRTSPRSQIL